MSSRPNVLFILADQHGHRMLGHAGHPDVKTPALDRMAAEGVRCRNAVTQNPICTPSRMCWLSGQYAHNHGYYGLSGPNPGGLPTVLGHFRRHGYKTAAIGKIHCPEYWVEDDCDAFHETTVNCSIGGRSPAYRQYLKEHDAEDLEDHLGFRELTGDSVQRLDARPSGAAHEHSQEGWGSRQAMDFMAGCADEGQQFFVHLSLPRPHQSYAPAQEFWDQYEGVAFTLPPNADIDLAKAGTAPHLRQSVAWTRKAGPACFEPKTFEALRQRKLQGYYGQISEVDHTIGEIRRFLAERGLAENTIVIYSADHGEYAYEFGLPEKAPGICADAVCRIPMLWAWPGQLPAGREIDPIVETVDMVDTLCAFCALPRMETSDGQDVSPLLRGRCEDGPRTIGVTEFTWSKAVFDGRYRLVYYPPQMFADECPEGFGELYDLDEDPWEMRNRYDDAELTAVRMRLERQLLDWIVTTTRPATVIPGPAEGSWSGEQWQHRFGRFVNADGKIPPRRLLELRTRNYL